ncbi:MAG TPA: hypothetical protein VMA32_04300 [Streptosporangiaceae bacterium]|nr:hypothetical protein [Streptosporangiaceae bacterium]
MPAGRVAAVRAIPVVAALAGVMLSACGLSLNGTGGNQAYRSGYAAGAAARAHHTFPHGATKLHVTAFCVESAVTDVRAVKYAVLPWTEGFEKGCLHK